MPAPLAVYAAAMDVALTSPEESEREGARLLIRELGAETFGERPRLGLPRRGLFTDLLRETLAERLGGAPPQ